MSDSDNQKLVTSTELGALMGMTGQNIRDLMKKGIIDGVNKGTRFMFNPYLCIPQYIDYIKTQGIFAASNDKARKLAADADYARARADTAMLELAELKGELHRSDDVRDLVSLMLSNVRADYLSLVTRLPVLLGLDNKAAASKKLMSELSTRLDRLREYEYDPKQYAALVRERRGWKEQNESEENEESGED